MIYLWVKTLHVLAIISWMAGLLYLPRLFVYHADVEHGSEPARLFEIMEFRLYRYIMTPAMIVAWLTGLQMAVSQSYWGDIWFLIKFALVISMSAVHGMLGGARRRFAAGTNLKSSRYFRVLNEVPTVLMIFIVGFVIFKPAL
jgi:putative membrane protein